MLDMEWLSPPPPPHIGQFYPKRWNNGYLLILLENGLKNPLNLMLLYWQPKINTIYVVRELGLKVRPAQGMIGRKQLRKACT